MRTVEVILKDIEEFIPVDDEWEALDELIFEALSANDSRIIKSLLGVLERNQEHDGYGVFWSIVHGLEGAGNYEKELVLSLNRRPHEMSLIILNRMLNGGLYEIDGKPILNVLEEIALNQKFPESIREIANDFICYQQKNM